MALPRRKLFLSLVRCINLRTVILFSVLMILYLSWPVSHRQMDTNDEISDVVYANQLNIDNNIAYQYCYKDTGKTIIFIRLIDEVEWHPLEVCAIKSAAKAHPDYGICILTVVPAKMPAQLSLLHKVEIALLNAEKLLRGTPAFGWYLASTLAKQGQAPLLMSELIDVLQYAYLYKYGGIYLENDVITLKSLALFQNAVAVDDDDTLYEGMLIFEKGHPFMETALQSLSTRFRGTLWGAAGPHLINHLHAKKVIKRSKYAVILAEEFYVLSPGEIDAIFDPAFRSTLKSMTEGVFTLQILRGDVDVDDYIPYWTKKEPYPEGSFINEIMVTVCA